MQIQIQLSQQDIETAIRDYLVKAGMTSPVDTINFTVPRKSDDDVRASIDLTSEGTPQVTSPANAESKTTSQVKPAPVSAKPKAQSKSEPEPKDKTEAPEPVKNETPFEPDPAPEPEAKDTESANDSTEAEPTKESRKLFG